MWIAESIAIDSGIHKISLLMDGSHLSYENVIQYWYENYEFRDFYFSILRESPFDAFFWENPPVTKSNIKQAYEFVLVNSPQLSKVDADPTSFQDKFNLRPPGQNAIAFENLGRDAELIVPCPIAPHHLYAHFASFIREAPEGQKHDLFTTVANSLKNRMNDKPPWVSTSGLGVYWLHIRLDARPKYYSYEAYRHFVGRQSL